MDHLPKLFKNSNTMQTKAILFIILFGGTLLLYSCSKKSNDVLLANITVAMEAEGGEQNIVLDSDFWQIAGLINNNGDINMWGNIYGVNGDIIAKNSVLQLEGLGSLETNSQGVRILHHDPRLLTIVLQENQNGEDYSFTVLLQNQNKVTRKIVVAQKKSQGYRFKNITYSRDENDGDSLYIKIAHRITFINHGGSPGAGVSFDPLGGSSEIMNVSYFKSDMPDAFKWLQKDSVAVDVPLPIDNGIKWSGGDKRIYGIVTALTGKSNKTETVVSGSGESRYYTAIEFRKRQLSYTLTLINNRTGEKKLIDGKWIEHAPTGSYKVVKEL